jgi:hypothetical protein
MSSTVPMMAEQTSSGEGGYDILSRLLKSRIVLLGTLIDDVVPPSDRRTDRGYAAGRPGGGRGERSERR